MRLIDPKMSIDTIKSYIEVWDCKGCLPYGETQHNVMAVDDLQYLPTIEAEPVRHGRWERVPYTSHCGCGKKFNVFRYNCSECNRTSEFQAYGLRFCPYCGADNGDAIKGGADNG